MKSPAFQFYPNDHLGSQRVQLLSLEEEGAYFRLLCYCWIHGSIPSDISLVTKLIGKGATTTLATTVCTMFQAAGKDRLVHERLDAERRKQEKWRQKSAEGGRKAAKTRAKLRSQGVDPTNRAQGSLENGTNQKATLLSSSSSSSSNTDIGKSSTSLRETAPRPRNQLLDRMAALDGSDPLQVTGGAWAGLNRALRDIKSVTPDVTVAEIDRRAENYRRHFPGISISGHALAKHWARCDHAPANLTTGQLPLDEAAMGRRRQF